MRLELGGSLQALHGVRGGKVGKQQARVVPSRGGGGGSQNTRGRGNSNYGNSNYGNRRRQGQQK